MSQTQDTIVAALMEQLIVQGPEGMAQVFTALFNLAMRLKREHFLGARLYERSPDRRGYANGYKSKTLDTTAGTVTVDVPKADRNGRAFLSAVAGARAAWLWEQCHHERTEFFKLPAGRGLWLRWPPYLTVLRGLSHAGLDSPLSPRAESALTVTPFQVTLNQRDNPYLDSQRY